MADWTGIKAAIATKLGAVSGINSASSTDLEGLGEMPSVKVTGITGWEIDASVGSQEFTEATINCDLLIGRPGPITDAIANSDTLIEAIRVAVRTDTQLGYPGVVEYSWIARMDVGEMEYAGEKVFGAKMAYHVKTYEQVSRT